ncbi:uncharacterized protein LOC117173297 [Belonocnema kinseyi]|uniref:uncharacterized protein LOC117173297 n=1 Tax=Belonocnema kinseyi TaxID=2817044 RepID=UPI00143DB992|nr:uncharacterized protein LOC117173297 [Belonocnema kinseyi]
MCKKYGNNCKLLYTDTDSFIYEVKCKVIYADMKEDIKNNVCQFHTSYYPVDNVFDMPQANKKVLGIMKYECSGQIVTEFVGLQSKMYSLRVNGEDFVKKSKGVKAAVLRTQLYNLEHSFSSDCTM